MISRRWVFESAAEGLSGVGVPGFHTEPITVNHLTAVNQFFAYISASPQRPPPSHQQYTFRNQLTLQITFLCISSLALAGALQWCNH
ncbi:hypothetical protein J6590_075591 [Homalodisca vitripennis]|nr:hypothetical protein J6590_075591 [Homalodisca vitripennis]